MLFLPEENPVDNGSGPLNPLSVNAAGKHFVLTAHQDRIEQPASGYLEPIKLA